MAHFCTKLYNKINQIPLDSDLIQCCHIFFVPILEQIKRFTISNQSMLPCWLILVPKSTYFLDHLKFSVATLLYQCCNKPKKSNPSVLPYWLFLYQMLPKNPSLDQTYFSVATHFCANTGTTPQGSLQVCIGNPFGLRLWNPMQSDSAFPVYYVRGFWRCLSAACLHYQSLADKGFKILTAFQANISNPC